MFNFSCVRTDILMVLYIQETVRLNMVNIMAHQIRLKKDEDWTLGWLKIKHLKAAFIFNTPYDSLHVCFTCRLFRSLQLLKFVLVPSNRLVQDHSVPYLLFGFDHFSVFIFFFVTLTLGIMKSIQFLNIQSVPQSKLCHHY